MMREVSNPAFYDADSSRYDQARWTTRSGAFTNRVQQEIVRKWTADWRGAEVLEVGPGTARFTIPLARQGNQLTLVDISSGMLATARGNLRREGLESAVVDYIRASLYQLPLDANRFDHAICLNVFSHLEDVPRALAQLARVVRPGGQVLVNYPNLQSYYWPVARRVNRRGAAVGQDVYSAWQDPRAVRQAIDQAGLNLISCRGHVHVPRALEGYLLLPLVQLLDVASRCAPLSRVAPVHFCLCRKRP